MSINNYNKTTAHSIHNSRFHNYEQQSGSTATVRNIPTTIAAQFLVQFSILSLLVRLLESPFTLPVRAQKKMIARVRESSSC